MAEASRTRQLADQLHKIGLGISTEGQARLLIFLAELLHWNRRYNLTAITDPIIAIERHLVDSLSLLLLDELTGPLLDIGSGPGLPGLALAMVRPDLQVISLERTGKKVLFQRHVTRRLGLKNVSIIHARAEDAAEDPQLAGNCACVTSRAFSDLTKFAEIAVPYLQPAGCLIAMKGKGGPAEWQGAQATLSAQGLFLERRLDLRLPVSMAERNLFVLRHRLSSLGEQETAGI